MSKEQSWDSPVGPMDDDDTPVDNQDTFEQMNQTVAVPSISLEELQQMIAKREKELKALESVGLVSQSDKISQEINNLKQRLTAAELQQKALLEVKKVSNKVSKFDCQHPGQKGLYCTYCGARIEKDGPEKEKLLRRLNEQREFDDQIRKKLRDGFDPEKLAVKEQERLQAIINERKINVALERAAITDLTDPIEVHVFLQQLTSDNPKYRTTNAITRRTLDNADKNIIRALEAGIDPNFEPNAYQQARLMELRRMIKAHRADKSTEQLPVAARLLAEQENLFEKLEVKLMDDFDLAMHIMHGGSLDELPTADKNRFLKLVEKAELNAKSPDVKVHTNDPLSNAVNSYLFFIKDAQGRNKIPQKALDGCDAEILQHLTAGRDPAAVIPKTIEDRLMLLRVMQLNRLIRDFNEPYGGPDESGHYPAFRRDVLPATAQKMMAWQNKENKPEQAASEVMLSPSLIIDNKAEASRKIKLQQLKEEREQLKKQITQLTKPSVWKMARNLIAGEKPELTAAKLNLEAVEKQIKEIE